MHVPTQKCMFRKRAFFDPSQLPLQHLVDPISVKLIQFFLFFRFDSGTGHYTQIVWGETTKIGCGATTYRKDSFFRKALVCNYGKAGNFIRTPMYKVGNPCSKCPSGSVCSSKYQGLCVFSGNQPLPIPNRPGVSPILPSNNLPIIPSTVQGTSQ